MKGRFQNLGNDGLGNFWFVWNSHVHEGFGPVYYYMHEGPILLFQSDDMEVFVRECLRMMTPPYASLIDDLHEFRLRPIKTLNADLKSRSSVLSGSDATQVEFARTLSEDAQIYDFRGAKPGDGVDLKQLEILAVHPSLPILGVRRRKGLFATVASLFSGKKKGA
jgi:hypothetical protein